MRRSDESSIISAFKGAALKQFCVAFMLDMPFRNVSIRSASKSQTTGESYAYRTLLRVASAGIFAERHHQAALSYRAETKAGPLRSTGAGFFMRGEEKRAKMQAAGIKEPRRRPFALISKVVLVRSRSNRTRLRLLT